MTWRIRFGSGIRERRDYGAAGCGATAGTIRRPIRASTQGCALDLRTGGVSWISIADLGQLLRRAGLRHGVRALPSGAARPLARIEYANESFILHLLIGGNLITAANILIALYPPASSDLIRSRASEIDAPEVCRFWNSHLQFRSHKSPLIGDVPNLKNLHTVEKAAFDAIRINPIDRLFACSQRLKIRFLKMLPDMLPHRIIVRTRR
jgi:hypothetical protein